MFGHGLTENVLAEGHLYLFILRSVRLAPESLMTIHKSALKKSHGNKDKPVKHLLPTAPVRLCGLRAGMGCGEWFG